MANDIRIAIVGFGKIARDQHVAAIAATEGMELVAVVSAHGAEVEGVPMFASLEELYASGIDCNAASHCNTPSARYRSACSTIARGLATLLEKPPFASLSQCFEVADLARQHSSVLATSWHSQHNAAVEEARLWLADKHIRDIRMKWVEDVRKWHPDQEWIWQPGGYGVFDPGMNGLSILTAIVPFALHISASELFVPSDKAMPIAATLEFGSDASARIGSAQLDWRGGAEEHWDIEVECDEGLLRLHEGGKRLSIDGADIAQNNDGEYRGIYRSFAEAVRTGRSMVDFAPLRLVADAFTLAERHSVAPFSPDR